MLTLLTFSGAYAAGWFTWRTITQTYFNIDVGRGSHVAMCDIDADGDRDLFIGEEYGNIRYYRNDGTPSNPNFIFVTSAFGGIDAGWWANPEFADTDGDNDYDLYVGDADDGGTRFYRNTGSPTNPVYAYIGLIDTDGYDDCPRFADIDADGDLDLFVGHGHHGSTHPNMGKIAYYRNTGNASSPVWTFVTNEYAGINTGNYAQHTFYDLDGDGDLDLLIGNDRRGYLYFYRNDGTIYNASYTFVTDDYYHLNRLTNTSRHAPYLVDLDADSDAELLMGKLDGTIAYSRQDTTVNMYVAVTGSDSTGNGTTLSPYRTIRYALNKSAAYDTIIVKSGLYNPAGGDTCPLNMRSSVTVMSESGSGQTTINANATQRVISFDSLGGTPVLTGFRITGGNRDNGAGIYINKCNPIVRGNIIAGNTATIDGGGVFVRRGQPEIMLNRILNNRANDDAGGVYVTDTCYPIIQRNLIAYNSATDAGAGIYAYGSFPAIKKNTIAGNVGAAARGGVFTSYYGGATIDSNAIVDNYIGVGHWTDADTVFMRGNNIYYNTFQPADTEVCNQSVSVMQYPGNFWLDQDSARIDSFITGPVQYMPVLASPVPGAAGEPVTITQVRVFTDSTYTTDMSTANIGDTMYVQVIGNDWNYRTYDPALVIVRSNANAYGIAAALLELDTLSGFYRGPVYITASSSDIYNRIQVNGTDVIVLSSRADPTKTDTVFINPIAVEEDNDRRTVGPGLRGIAPNPVRDALRISFVPSLEIPVSIRIYNAAGRCVRSYAGLPLGSGTTVLTWDLRDHTGNRVSPGIYFVEITDDADGQQPIFRKNRKVVVL